MGSCNVWCCPVFTNGWASVFQTSLQDTAQRLEVNNLRSLSSHFTKCAETQSRKSVLE